MPQFRRQASLARSVSCLTKSRSSCPARGFADKASEETRDGDFDRKMRFIFAHQIKRGKTSLQEHCERQKKHYQEKRMKRASEEESGQPPCDDFASSTRRAVPQEKAGWDPEKTESSSDKAMGQVMNSLRKMLAEKMQVPSSPDARPDTAPKRRAKSPLNTLPEPAPTLPPLPSSNTPKTLPKTWSKSGTKFASQTAPKPPPDTSKTAISKNAKKRLKEALNNDDNVALGTGLEVTRASKGAKKKKGEAGPRAKDDSTAGAAKKKEGAKKFTIETFTPDDMRLTPVEKKKPPVPGLTYGLDRVLFNPGVYHLQDPRSRVFNFDPYLAAIMPVQDFDFDALKQYVTSSRDERLISMALAQKSKYTGSTSSMSAMLSHFHYLLSANRLVCLANVSKQFPQSPLTFTRVNRAPAATFLHWKDGTYAIDADKQYDTANILSMLGKSMEKLLTLPKEEFEKYRRNKSHQIPEADKDAPESFHYTTMGDFMMRSQLDAYDARIPGTGMFDLKTRAVVSIRMDAKGYEKGVGYEIRKRFGLWESFEREYVDMIRSAFLKYLLQVRMGRMDGIFVAFHNTRRIFGFQYVPLSEMDQAIHNTEDLRIGDAEFKASLHLFNKVLDKCTERFPKQTLRLHVETREGDPGFMYIFVTPVTPTQVEHLHKKSRRSIEEFERDFLRMKPKAAEEGIAGNEEEAKTDEGEAAFKDSAAEAEEKMLDEQVNDDSVWDDVMDKVEKALEDEEDGVSFVREAIEDALERSGLLIPEDPENSRDYLDRLVETITGSSNAPESPELLSDDETHEDAEEVAEGAVEEASEKASTEITEKAATRTAEGESNFLHVSQASDLATNTVPEAENNHVRETTEAGLEIAESDIVSCNQALDKPEPGELEGDAKKLEARQDLDVGAASLEESRASDAVHLRDLILRLAGQLRHDPSATSQNASENKEDEIPSDAKLREFVAILAEMTSKIDVGGPRQGSQQPLSHAGEGSASQDAAIRGCVLLGNPGVSVKMTPRKEADFGDDAEPLPEPGKLFGMTLTIKNKIDGRYVTRVESNSADKKWTVEYAIEELPEGRARPLYQKLKERRKAALSRTMHDAEYAQLFRGSLVEKSKEGKMFREKEDKLQRGQPVHVYGAEAPFKWDSIFTAKGEAREDGLYKLWKESREEEAKEGRTVKDETVARTVVSTVLT